ncbi:hypothetical protein [Companilactobacillus furfuricola]|nr:hypothetical protein [Companilactobacillus furfuricola]
MEKIADWFDKNERLLNILSMVLQASSVLCFLLIIIIQYTVH